MQTINGVKYLEVTDLAEFWDVPRTTITRRFNETKALPASNSRRAPKPDRYFGKGRQLLWKTTRLGELNAWRNAVINRSPR